MFLRLLNEDQKRTLVVIAHHLVVSDHSVSEKEGDLLDELLMGLRTTVPISPKELYTTPNLAVLTSREVRVAVMLEILTLACGDNIYLDAESKLVQKLSKDLGFSLDEYALMKVWGEKNAALFDEALALMV